MSEGTHTAFNQIVQDGLLAANGMAAFDDVLSGEDTTMIHHYVRARAEQDVLPLPVKFPYRSVNLAIGKPG